MSQTTEPAGGHAPVSYGLAEIAARAAAVRQRSAALVAAGTQTAARPEFGFSHVIAYGESLSTGWEGWPALTTDPVHDCLMIGESVRGLAEHGAGWITAGEEAFRPLVATVTSVGVKGELLGAEAVAALERGNNALGETVLEGALHYWRGRQLALRAQADDGRFAGRMVASACGIGGRSIEQLSRGQPAFERPVQAAQAGRRLAEAAGASYGVAALLWLQGEGNSVGNAGTQDAREYVRLCAALQADLYREIAAGVAGQARMPAVFTHQVGSIYVRDEAGLSIPMAQLECAYALRDWFMVGPAYPVTEKGGHLDANGYRWLGQQFGKVMHRVLDLGQGWKPLHPLRATVRGASVLVDFHVPHPPLAFGPCWRRNDTVEFPDGGFSVTDEAGRVGVAAAAAVGETSVLLVLERAPGAKAMLWYADQAHGGHGNLHDSDPTEASQAYEYRPGSGQYPSADIAALKGKPYPLWNWCVAFRVPLQPDPAPVAAAPEPVAPEPAAPAPPPPTPAPPDSPKPPEAPEPPRLAEVPPAPPPASPDPLDDMLRPEPEDLPPEAMDSPAWRVLRGEEEAPPPPPPEPPRRSWLRRLFGG